MIFESVTSIPEFERDFKKLSKKFRTLKNDLKTFIETQLFIYHKRKIDNGGIFRIPGLDFESPAVYKARKLACKSLKGKGVHSGIRVIYAYFEDRDRIEFIEIYYKKKDSTDCDRKRIKKYYSRKSSRRLNPGVEFF